MRRVQLQSAAAFEINISLTRRLRATSANGSPQLASYLVDILVWNCAAAKGLTLHREVPLSGMQRQEPTFSYLESRRANAAFQLGKRSQVRDMGADSITASLTVLAHSPRSNSFTVGAAARLAVFLSPLTAINASYPVQASA